MGSITLDSCLSEKSVVYSGKTEEATASDTTVVESELVVASSIFTVSIVVRYIIG